MNGAIELPGEAAPLSPQQVLQALQAASSQQQNLIRSGTAQLQTWETVVGYYPMLQVRDFTSTPNSTPIYTVSCETDTAFRKLS